MRAKLKRLHSPDVHDLEGFVPPMPDDFGFLLQMMVGREDSSGEESFDVIVCTPRWLERRYAKNKLTPLRHHLLVFEYHYEGMLGELKRLVESYDGKDWQELAEKI